MAKTLGEKIKELRVIRGMTQSELAADKVTRNMLSLIENDQANPSLETLKHIADALSISVSYLMSDDEDLLFYEKKAVISNVYRAYEAKRYGACVDLILSLSSLDDELAFILSSAKLALGKRAVENGNLTSAKKLLDEAENYAKSTRMDTTHIEAQIPMYRSIAENVQSPLLEFDSQKYATALTDAMDYELYKYLLQDFEYEYVNTAISEHMKAKAMMREHRYTDAAKKLVETADLLKNESYNAFVIFSIYSDLETCYKQLYDFEKAYAYSTKRITLLEGFKS